MRLLVRQRIHNLYRLNHMRMRTDHMIHSQLQQPACQLTVCVLRQQLILYPPVHASDNGIRIHPTGLDYILTDLLAVYQVNHSGRRNRNPVCTIRIIKDCDTETFLFNQKRIPARPIKRIPIDARIPHFQRIKHPRQYAPALSSPCPGNDCLPQERHQTRRRARQTAIRQEH